MQKMIVSNTRFPEDVWLQVKIVASSKGMSINEYLTNLVHSDTIKTFTGTKRRRIQTKGYKAMENFMNRKRSGKPMGMSDEDIAIYDP